MTAGFAVQGLTPDAFAVIGGWQSKPDDSLSFTTGEDASVQLWRADLPASETAARAMFGERAAAMEESKRLIAAAGAQMQQLHPEMIAGAATSFAARAEVAPADELLLTLGALRAEAGGDVSFALGLPGLPADWRETVRDYFAFSEQMLRLLRPSLQIETRVEAALLAVTELQLDGDANHSWPTSIPAGQAWQHGRTVRLTLQTRQALLQLMAQVTTGAIALAPRFLGGGATAVLALPATYKFIKRTVAQLRQLRVLERQLREVG